MELTETVSNSKSYHLKLTATNKVYKAYLNDKLVLTLLSNLDLENGYPGLVAADNNYYFRDILVK